MAVVPHRSSSTPPSVTSIWLIGAVLLWFLYSLVFRATQTETAVTAAIDGIVNVAPLVILGAAVRLALAVVMRRGVRAQAAWNTGLAVAFALTWYALIMVLHALVDGLGGRGYVVRAFGPVAFTWQVFQGLIMYALVAAICYAVRGGRGAASVTIVAAPALERYLTRSGDELVPVNVRDIVAIVGAQDYAEVSTLAGRHLVRMSLAEFERRLDPARFLRVHRSTIINLDHLASAEPAGGGCLLARMTDGEIVKASRAGSQVLRALVV